MLAQPIVHGDRARGAEPLADDRRGSIGPALRAGNDRGRGGLGQCRQQPTDHIGLGDAARGQRRVEPALIPPLEIPQGLAVADQQDGHGAIPGLGKR